MVFQGSSDAVLIDKVMIREIVDKTNVQGVGHLKRMEN